MTRLTGGDVLPLLLVQGEGVPRLDEVPEDGAVVAGASTPQQPGRFVFVVLHPQPARGPWGA